MSKNISDMLTLGVLYVLFDSFAISVCHKLKPMHPFVLKEIISVSMILFAIIDILGAIPVIIELRQKAGHIQSEKASIAVLVLMVGFLFAGDEMLKVIGLDVASFAIAGSLVIFIIAMEMVLGINLFKEDMPESVSIVPLAFPLI